MNLTEWAKNEIEIACKKERSDKTSNEWDYGCACYESAYKAFQSLMADGHSGFSIGVTKSILFRLIACKPLTQIEDTPDIWDDCICEFDGGKSYQCKRMTSLFKDVYDDGRVQYTDVDRYVCVYKDNPEGGAWSNGTVTRLIDELYPITMPYFPPAKHMRVYCTECLSDPTNGDFDTIGVWYIDKPDGTKDIIERFFAESEDGTTMVEISREEYDKRAGGKENA